MNIERKFDSYFRRAARTPAAWLTVALLISASLTGACDGEGGPPKAPEPQVGPEPEPGCLTAIPCASSCGGRLNLDLADVPHKATAAVYGDSECPKYFIIDLANSTPRPAGSVDLRIAPEPQPLPCEGSELRIYVYGHNSSGWTKLPAMTKTLAPIKLQGQCAFSDYREAFGSMPEFDRFRVLAGGVMGDGKLMPLGVQLQR